MDNHILNEVKRNRELMGIMEQTQPQGKLIGKGNFTDVHYEMYEDVTKLHMGPFLKDDKDDFIEDVFLNELKEIGIPESECSSLKIEGKTISCEIDTNEIKNLLGLDNSELNEQGVVDAVTSGIESGEKFSDDEYRLLGMIDDFLKKPIDTSKSFDEKADWIETVRAPMGRFGVTLFNYLNNGGEKYDEEKFTVYLNTFDKLINKSITLDDKLIIHGKNIKNFQYSN